MLRCQDFVAWIEGLGVDFYAGVPDSLLKSFGCGYFRTTANYVSKLKL